MSEQEKEKKGEKKCFINENNVMMKVEQAEKGRDEHGKKHDQAGQSSLDMSDECPKV